MQKTTKTEPRAEDVKTSDRSNVTARATGTGATRWGATRIEHQQEQHHLTGNIPGIQLYEHNATIGLFITSEQSEKEYIKTMLHIGKHEFGAITDTGADVSICTPAVANNQAFETIGWPTTTLLMPDGNQIPVSEAVQGVIRYGNTVKAYLSTNFVVPPISLPEAAILGGVTLIAMHDRLGPGLLKYDRDKGFNILFDREAKGQVAALLEKQKEATNDLESQSFEVTEYMASNIAAYTTRTYVAGRIRGKKAVGRWDTGAPRSLCRATTAFQYGIKKISAKTPEIYFLTGRPIKSIGVARIIFDAANFESTIEALIVPDTEYNGIEDILLGLDWTAEAASRCNFIFNISRK
ncbi:hypothetical protein AAVH_17474 [Aphelenchoides avenae]|nr:hypothetical protein AAVH_17474 [Aphelenchus avenae]